MWRGTWSQGLWKETSRLVIFSTQTQTRTHIHTFHQVLDLTSMDELACYLNQHAKSRLFRQDGGVTKLCMKPGGILFSCGVDGSIRSRTLP